MEIDEKKLTGIYDESDLQIKALLELKILSLKKELKKFETLLSLLITKKKITKHKKSDYILQVLSDSSIKKVNEIINEVIRMDPHSNRYSVRAIISRLCACNKIKKVGPGLYQLPCL